MNHKLTAHNGDPCEYCNVPHDDVPSGPCKSRLAQLADTEITSDWLSENFKVEPYCWKLPVEGYYIGATTSGYYRGRFDVFRVEDDGDETTIGQVATALHLVNMLKVIELAESVAVIRDNVLHERNQMAESVKSTHMHVGPDRICATCGMDLTNSVHKRV